MANALAQAASPYLLQHRDNPVDWREWNEATLALARERNQPILLSVGYAACHWCHVMAHESFESPAVAELMNRDFVSIKVDREERPDIDAIYQQALQLMGEQGGWPLTMFLTPDGEPFWGGTYFPPEPRYGRQGFPQVLEQVAELWRTQNPRLFSNREALNAAIRQMAAPEPGAGLPLRLAISTARQLGERFDAVHGGLGGAPKFPQAPILHMLWEVGLATADPTLRNRVLHTLLRMSQGGIYDHLGGGYARYSTDAYWLVPHFEKMLYDNAQLLELLGRAFASTGNPLFAERAAETVAWLEREMLVEGAFAASLDADSEGEEGRFYVWQADEIDEVLGADAPAFKLAYGVTATGNWEGKSILHRLHEPGLPPPELAEGLRRSRERLLAVRATRIAPGLDDKVLADWNGLMIAGLAEAAGFLGEPRWLDLAGTAFQAVLAHMSDGERLVHSWRGGRRLPMAFLDDYAQMARAALALFEQTGEGGYLNRAQAWVRVLDEEFKAEGGAYHTTAASAGDLLVRPLATHDGPSPAGNGTLAQVSARLWHLTGDAAHRERTERILAALTNEVRRGAGAHASLLEAIGILERPAQLVVTGEPATPGFSALWQVAVRSPVPHRILLRVGPGRDLPPDHPAAGKALREGRAAAYLCLGQTCEAPASDARALQRRLDELTGPGGGTY